MLAKQGAWGSLVVASVFQIVCTYCIPLTIGTVIPVNTDPMSAFDVGGSQKTQSTLKILFIIYDNSQRGSGHNGRQNWSRKKVLAQRLI